MAADFGALSTNYISRSASLISSTDPRPISFSCRIKTDSGWSYGSNILHTLLNNNYSSSSPNLMLLIRSTDGINATMDFFNGGYAASSSTFVPNTSGYDTFTWVVWDGGSTDSVEYFLNGVSIGTASRVSDGSTTDGASIGTLSGAANNFLIQGLVAEVGVWNAKLSLADAKGLSAGYAPHTVQPQKLVSYIPMINISGNDTVLSPWASNGTIAVADHAPVRRRSAQILRFPSAVGAPVTNTLLQMKNYMRFNGALI